MRDTCVCAGRTQNLLVRALVPSLAGRKEARSSRSRRRRPHTSGPCSLDAPWYAAPSIRAQEQSHAHVARKSTPINSDQAFPPCAVSAPRRPSSRRLEKENLRVRGRGQRDGVRDTSQRRGIAKTAVGAFAQRQHSTAEEELLEVASSSMLEVSSARRASRSPAPHGRRHGGYGRFAAARTGPDGRSVERRRSGTRSIQVRVHEKKGDISHRQSNF